MNLTLDRLSGQAVSVPLRGKEGAGHLSYADLSGAILYCVSVPLRGKEGAGQRG